jgi:hypothetical protein
MGWTNEEGCEINTEQKVKEIKKYKNGRKRLIPYDKDTKERKTHYFVCHL